MTFAAATLRLGWDASPAGATPTALLRPPQLNAIQLANWFKSSATRVANYRATVPIESLAAYYQDEGIQQGVAGDIAFCQAVLETGSFSYPAGGQVLNTDNNFAGIGACDGCGGLKVIIKSHAVYGVRRHIHHLWAYAQPGATQATTALPGELPGPPCRDGTFDRTINVIPTSIKGKVQTVQQLSGTWASDPNYASKILDLYAQAGRFSGVNLGPTLPELNKFVDAAYKVFLGRPADASGKDYWSRRIIEGVITIPAFCDTMARSDEWLSVSIRELYSKALGRVADPDGLAYWIGRVRAGMRLTDVGALFYGSPEYVQRSGGTSESFVSALYRDLLERVADPAGLSFWAGEHRRGVPASSIAGGFYASVESRGRRVDGLYTKVLGRLPDGAGRQFWVGELLRLDDVALAANLASSDEFFTKALAA